MPKTITISANNRSKRSSLSVSGAVGGVVVSWACAKWNLPWWWGAWTTLGFLVIIWVFRDGRRDDKRVHVVMIFPFGIQLSISRNGRTVGIPTLLPRDQILDVVVNEVILPHKVVNILLARMLKDNGESRHQYEKDIQGLMAMGKVHLVPLFPGVELTYVTCLSLQQTISDALAIDPAVATS